MFPKGTQEGSSWKSALTKPKQSVVHRFLLSFTSAFAILIAVGSENLQRQISLTRPLGEKDQWQDLLGLFIRMQKMETGRRLGIPAVVPSLFDKLKL